MNDGLRSAATLTCTTRRGTARGGRQRVRTAQPLFAHASVSRTARAARSSPPAQPIGGDLGGDLPVDRLDLAVAEAARAQGSRAVVDVLIAALTGAAVSSDALIDRHLDRLKSACRQTRRYREAIPVIKRIAELNPTRRHEVAAELAMVHAHLGEHATGVSLLQRALAAQRRLAPHRRSQSFWVAAEIAARVLGEPALAREVAELGRATAQDLALASSSGVYAFAAVTA
jgi:hypothetical protein